MKNKHVLKLTVSSVFVGVAVALSGFYLPVGVAKVFPIQHAINVLLAVLVGPWYALGAAVVASTLRVMMGTGSLLAYPGSMFGAVLAGIMYKKFKHIGAAFVGELMGTGFIGAIVGYFIAIAFMGKEAALFGFVIPFSMSACVGALISSIILLALQRTKVLNKMTYTLEGEK